MPPRRALLSAAGLVHEKALPAWYLKRAPPPRFVPKTLLAVAALLALAVRVQPQQLVANGYAQNVGQGDGFSIGNVACSSSSPFYGEESFGNINAVIAKTQVTFDISQGNNWVETWIQLQGFNSKTDFFLRRNYNNPPSNVVEWVMQLNAGGGGALGSLSFGNQARFRTRASKALAPAPLF